jgi:hypothetical protein
MPPPLPGGKAVHRFGTAPRRTALVSRGSLTQGHESNAKHTTARRSTAQHSTAQQANARPSASLAALSPLSRLTATLVPTLCTLCVALLPKEASRQHDTRAHFGGKRGGGGGGDTGPCSARLPPAFVAPSFHAQHRRPSGKCPSLSLSLRFPPPDVRPPSRPIGGSFEWIRGFEINLVAWSPALASPTCSVGFRLGDAAARLPKIKKKVLVLVLVLKGRVKASRCSSVSGNRLGSARLGIGQRAARLTGHKGFRALGSRAKRASAAQSQALRRRSQP